MRDHLIRILALVFVCLVAACGGGGGDDAGASAPATATPDMAAAYVGVWTLSCAVTAPPDPTHPDGLSEDEVLTLTKDGPTRLSVSSVTSIYNNSSCSTLTSYYRSFPVGGQVDVVGTLASTLDIDRLHIQRLDGRLPVKALARVQGSLLFITRADVAGAVLDAGGYPAALDVSRGYTRAP